MVALASPDAGLRLLNYCLCPNTKFTNRRLQALSKLAVLLAFRTGQLQVVAPIASALKVDVKTADRWIGLYEKLFFAEQVRAWRSNGFKRLIKATGNCSGHF